MRLEAAATDPTPPKLVEVKPAAAPAPASSRPQRRKAHRLRRRQPTFRVTAPNTAAPAPPVRSGYAVQVAAVRARNEADPFVKRLTAKGYDVYVEAPKGNQKMFRVRIGSFKTRREAQTLANKLQREEKLKPWVTR